MRPLSAFVLFTVLGLGGALACVETQYPGSELIGTFDFTAHAVDSVPPGTCTWVEMPVADFFFTGTFSRIPDGPTFFTLGDINHPATFDGQYITSSQTAPRVFADCLCAEGTQMDETLSVALLSRSQVDALQDPTQCPPNPLDGGVPPVGGGVTGPGGTGGSFDAVFACGELVDVVVPAESCTCAECPDPLAHRQLEYHYPLHGIRR